MSSSWSCCSATRRAVDVDADAPTLLALELALARRDEAAIPGGYEAVLAPDFLEIGSSGRLWTRAEILEALHAEPPNPSISIEAFEIADLGPDLILASYDTLGITSDGEARRGRRSSIWVRQDDHWQLRFHQGTPISLDEDEGAGDAGRVALTVAVHRGHRHCRCF